MSKIALTKKQSDILNFIKKYISKHGYSPSIKEICKKFNYASTNTVYEILKALEKKGYILRSKKGIARSIKIIGGENSTSEVSSEESQDNSLIIIGNGNSNNPFSVFMNPKGKIKFDKEYFQLTSSTFVSTVKDDGLANKGIHSGDLVVVEQNSNPGVGSIVLALVNDMILVREYLQDGSQFCLKATNKGFPKINFKNQSESLAILGIVKNSIKSF